MTHGVALSTADRASGAAFGVRGGFFMTMTIITTTTRFRGASG
jgi:hypothetical protein